jgi:hypothetical protein
MRKEMQHTLALKNVFFRSRTYAIVEYAFRIALDMRKGLEVSKSVRTSYCLVWL